VSVRDESPVVVDRQSREQWSVVVAKTLLKAWDQETLDLVIAGGIDEFIRVSTLYLMDQDLKRDDFKRIYHMLSHQASPAVRH
jgi:hypothetical protein